MLLVFMLHGGLEVCALARSLIRAARPHSIELKCTCTCCGDVCPMGEACCCGADKVPIAQPTGIFFKAMGCHPDGVPADANAIPDSFHFRFLISSTPLVLSQPHERSLICYSDLCETSLNITPPAPPPRSTAL